MKKLLLLILAVACITSYAGDEYIIEKRNPLSSYDNALRIRRASKYERSDWSSRPTLPTPIKGSGLPRGVEKWAEENPGTAIAIVIGGMIIWSVVKSSLQQNSYQ